MSNDFVLPYRPMPTPAPKKPHDNRRTLSIVLGIMFAIGTISWVADSGKTNTDSTSTSVDSSTPSGYTAGQGIAILLVSNDIANTTVNCTIAWQTAWDRTDHGGFDVSDESGVIAGCLAGPTP